MTRDFNKPNRDDSRSSFRDKPSNQYGEERSPRPARVRLNREMVDRAWENGAPSLHPDYRARNTNGQPPRNNWRSNQNSSPNAPGGNRAYGTRQNTNRNDSQNFERRSNNGYQSPRPSGAPRPDTGRPDGMQRSNGNGPAPYRSDGPRYNGTQRSNGNGPAPYRSDGPRYNGTQRSNGPPPRYDGTQRGNSQEPHRPGAPRANSRPAQERSSQINKPEGEHPRRGAARIVHPEKEYRPRAHDLKPPKEERPPHPRFLSRPEVQRERAAKRYEEFAEQFEGDYEQFDTSETPRQQVEPSERPTREERPTRPAREERPTHQRNDNRRGPNQERERFVTPLPDGRVLKGPRPVQRKNAEFWTNINSDTDALIDQVQVPAKEVVNVEQASTEEGEQTDATQALETQEQPTKRTSTPATRRKKAEVVKKPRSTGPKPSQKGHKWPTS